MRDMAKERRRRRWPHAARTLRSLVPRSDRLYTIGMARANGSLGALVLVVLLTAVGVAPFCAPAPAQAMPCCGSANPCPAGMKAPGCCRVQPASGAPQAPSSEAMAKGRVGRESLPVTLAARGSQGLGSIGLPVRALSTALFLAHSEPVPLYLLNASILR